MLEKKFRPVPPQSFTANGTIDGKVEVSDSTLFKTEQYVVVKADTLPPIRLQIKDIISGTTLYVGPLSEELNTRADISAYTTLLNATIQSSEQKRPIVSEKDVQRATYEEAPTVARRVIPVDKLGNPIDSNNPLPVDIIIESSRDNPDTPNIQQILANNAGVEEEIIIPDKTIKVKIRAKNYASFTISFVSGNPNKTFTIPAGNIYEENDIYMDNKKIYVITNKNNTILEVLTWALS